MKKKIPFNKPYNATNGIKFIENSIKGGHISGRGPFTLKSEKLLKKKIPGSKKILLTTSCTHALEISAILMNFKNGDEIIVPSYTYVTSALAFYMHGAKLVFADIRSDTLNIDENKIESLITKKTKCIVVVHYAGVGCEMTKIMQIAKKNNIIVIEDNAHSLFGKYKNKFLGTIGDLSTLSFHETKNLTCGEGGALLVNNNKFVKNAEIILEKGTNRIKFSKGLINKYSWVGKGSSYVLSDILASFLYSQLIESKLIQDKRKFIWNYYNKNLKHWSNKNNILLPHIPIHCKQSYHMYYILLPNKKNRDLLISFLSKKGIQAIFHYLPLNLSKVINKKNINNCPVSKNISERIIRIPFFNKIKKNELNYILEQINKFKVI